MSILNNLYCKKNIIEIIEKIKNSGVDNDINNIFPLDSFEKNRNEVINLKKCGYVEFDKFEMKSRIRVTEIGNNLYEDYFIFTSRNWLIRTLTLINQYFVGVISLCSLVISIISIAKN